MDLYGVDLGWDPDSVSGEGYSVEDILAEFHSDSGADTPAIEDRHRHGASARREGSAHARARTAEAPTKERRSRREAAAPAPTKKPRKEEAAPARERRPGAEAAELKTPAAPARVDEPTMVWKVPEKRASLPSEAEIRAFMANFERETSAQESAAQPPRYTGEPDFDERFHLDGRRERTELRYAGRRIDQSADENYTPHAPGEYQSSYAPEEPEEAEAEEESAGEEKPGFFKRLRQTLRRERQEARDKELARREAARKINFPETRELSLPGEEEAAEETIRGVEEEQPDPLELLRAMAAPASETEESSAETGASPEPEELPRAEAAPKADEQAAKLEEEAFKPAWSRAASIRRGYAVTFPDTSASPAIYAEPQEEDELEELPEENEGDALKDESFFPPNFKEYIFSLLTSLLYRLRGGLRGTMTADDDGEDLGEEVAPSFASRYYGSHIRSLRLRLRLCLALLAVLAWISLGLPVTGRLNDTAVACFLCLALQFGIMLLCLDVFTGGVLNGARGRPGLDTMAVIACFVTSADAVFSGLDGFSTLHIPLCLLSSVSLTGLLASSFYSCRALRKTLRVPAIARSSYTVTGETDVKTGEVTLLKSVRPVKGFVRRTEEAAPDETMFRKLCLPMLALAILLALLTAAIKRNVRDYFYILSVLLCPAVPFAGLLAFAMPFFTGAMRLFPSGAAVAGWSGVSDIGQSKNLIVTDRDLFPDGSVQVETVRIFADADPVEIISYAGSMLTACGSCVSSCFGELMKKNGGRMRRIENFELLPGGGVRGVIDSRVVLCGSTDLMQLMNVRIPYRLVGRNSVLLAADGLLYGIFNLRYDAQPAVRSALVGLMRSGRHPVFAIRDFNVTPSMLRDCFHVATDGYDFPPYVERFAMSEGTPGPDSQVAAVVCRDGLGPLSDTADIGRSIFTVTRANLIITVLGAISGMLTSFVQLLRDGGVGIPFLFFFMLLWAIPVWLAGKLLRFEH